MWTSVNIKFVGLSDSATSRCPTENIVVLIL